MANYYYPNDPRRFQRPARVSNTEPRLTVEDYEKLAAAYQELKEHSEQQAKQLEAKNSELASKASELAIKNEALQR